jgi:hypothetical protein
VTGLGLVMDNGFLSMPNTYMPRFAAALLTLALLLPSTPDAATVCEEVATPAVWGYTPTLNLLPDGRILLAGGRKNDMRNFLSRCELLDLTAKKFTQAAPMSSKRASHTSLGLPDGRVLVVGGMTKAVEVYDPKSNRWSRIGSLKADVIGVAATLTGDGKVLIVGGDLMWKGALSDEALLWDLKGKLQPQQSEAFAGEAFRTEKHGVLFYGSTWGDGPSGLLKREPGTGKFSVFDGDPQLTQAYASMPSGHGMLTTSDGQLVEPFIAYSGKGLMGFRSGKWEEIATFRHDHLSPAALRLPTGDVVVVGSGAGPLPAELCRLGEAPRGSTMPVEKKHAEPLDMNQGRDLGNRCFEHIKAGQWDVAETACKKGLEIAKDGNLIGALEYNMGRIAEARGNQGEARSHYRRSLEARPGNQATRERLEALDGRP